VKPVANKKEKKENLTNLNKEMHIELCLTVYCTMYVTEVDVRGTCIYSIKCVVICRNDKLQPFSLGIRLWCSLLTVYKKYVF